MIRRRYKFIGRVQGVGFRYTAIRAANALGVSGWVKNERDGSVTVEAQGTEVSLTRMIETIRNGSYIIIDKMEVTELTPVDSVGTLNDSMVSPREVFKSSILSNAASFIAIHNHPSGNLVPSDADRILTERLMECGKFMDIKLLDHIIVAGETGEMLSFKGEGILDSIEKNARSIAR